MYRFLLKRDLKHVSKYYLVILLILISLIVIGSLSSFLDMDTTSEFLFSILFGTVFLAEMFIVDIGTQIMLKKDLKQSNYYLTKIDDFGIYLNYKYFLNFAILLIILSISYLIYIFVVGEISDFSYIFFFYILCIRFFITWAFKITLFTTVFSNFLLLKTVSSKRASVIYLISGLLFSQFSAIFWINNNKLVFSIRIMFTVFVLNYICGMIINSSRRIR